MRLFFLGDSTVIRTSAFMQFRSHSIWTSIVTVICLGLCIGGCERPLKVEVDMAGSEKLPLKGELRVRGKLSRPIINGQNKFPSESLIKVTETWLRRQNKTNPPGYRISGHYDPATQAEGFVLPEGSIDIYFVGRLVSDNSVQVVVPAAYFKRSVQ